MWMWCNRDLHYTWQAVYYLLMNGDEFPENWWRWNTPNTVYVICFLFTGTQNFLSTYNNCAISSLISMIFTTFTTLQSNALSLEQWLTQNPSTPLDSTLGKKPHIIVNQATTFWMAKPHKQWYVRAMACGVHRHLNAEVSPSDPNDTCQNNG